MVITDMFVQTIVMPSQEPVLKVLVLNHHWLIGAAIASLLSLESDFELNGFAPTIASAMIVSALPEVVGRFSADAIVVDNLMASDAEIRHLCTTIGAHSTASVFVIHMEANVVCLNGSEMAVIAQAGDLAALIRRNHSQTSGCARLPFDIDA